MLVMNNSSCSSSTNDKEREVFAKLVKKARKNAQLTQKEFAKILNPPVSQQSVTGWERGLYIPDRKYWESLASLAGVELKEIYSFIGTQIVDKSTLASEIIEKIKTLGTKELDLIIKAAAEQWSTVGKDSFGANPQHIALLQKGAIAWNRWREKNPAIQPELRRVDFNDIDCNDLSKYDLSNADLREVSGYGTCFAKALLIGANLSSANLQHVNFQSCNMTSCNLSNATIKNSHLIRAILDSSNFSGAVFTDTNLSKSSLIKANLTNTKFTDADLSDCNLRDASVSGTELVRCKIGGISLWGININAISFADNLDTSTDVTNYIQKDNLAWALFCTLRRQQAEMFAPATLTMLLDQEQQVIEIATLLAEKYGTESQSEKSYLYVKQHNFTFYHISRKDDFLEVTATNPDRNAIIIRVNNGFIDSNIRQADVDNLKALLNKEEGSGNNATNEPTKKLS